MKTAIEQLADNLPFELKFLLMTEIEQAKKIEKEQIVNAYKEGHYHLDFDSFNPEQYYNETFKSETIVTEYRDGSIDVETFKSEE